MSIPLNPALLAPLVPPAIRQGGVEDGGPDAHLGGERPCARAPVAEPPPPREVLGREARPQRLPLGPERGTPLLFPPLPRPLLGREALPRPGDLWIHGCRDDRSGGCVGRGRWRRLGVLRLQFLPGPLQRRLDVPPDVAERYAAARVDGHVALARPVVVVQYGGVSQAAAWPLRMVGQPDRDPGVGVEHRHIRRADAEPVVTGPVHAPPMPGRLHRVVPGMHPRIAHLLQNLKEPLPASLCTCKPSRHRRLPDLGRPALPGRASRPGPLPRFPYRDCGSGLSAYLINPGMCPLSLRTAAA